TRGGCLWAACRDIINDGLRLRAGPRHFAHLARQPLIAEKGNAECGKLHHQYEVLGILARPDAEACQRDRGDTQSENPESGWIRHAADFHLTKKHPRKERADHQHDAGRNGDVVGPHPMMDDSVPAVFGHGTCKYSMGYSSLFLFRCSISHCMSALRSNG